MEIAIPGDLVKTKPLIHRETRISVLLISKGYTVTKSLKIVGLTLRHIIIKKKAKQ
ncbi:hypothetical protein [Shouchella shacheensis]|uniref:hypothetical protein n=1 Tax=Shouchella shacheensis TaxID=1649580 RepID=UPI000A4567E3|nr:hypothetical protein [Shouchella shacheensis]